MTMAQAADANGELVWPFEYRSVPQPLDDADTAGG
jgi:hypothetical protein